jgi:hypothetical protein
VRGPKLLQHNRFVVLTMLASLNALRPSSPSSPAALISAVGSTPSFCNCECDIPIAQPPVGCLDASLIPRVRSALHNCAAALVSSALFIEFTVISSHHHLHAYRIKNTATPPSDSSARHYSTGTSRIRISLRSPYSSIRKQPGCFSSRLFILHISRLATAFLNSLQSTLRLLQLCDSPFQRPRVTHQ